MKVTEEFLDVVSLKNTTTGRDIKDAVIKCMEDHQLNLKNLIGIATDGAPSMIGKKCWSNYFDSQTYRSFGRMFQLWKRNVSLLLLFTPGKLVCPSTKYVPCYDSCS